MFERLHPDRRLPQTSAALRESRLIRITGYRLSEKRAWVMAYLKLPCCWSWLRKRIWSEWREWRLRCLHLGRALTGVEGQGVAERLDEKFSLAVSYTHLPGCTIVARGSVCWGHEERIHLVVLSKLGSWVDTEYARSLYLRIPRSCTNNKESRRLI